jgi:hypothetical protein
MTPIALSSCVLLAGLVCGDVERRFVIATDPPGAAVYRDGLLIGTSPVDDYFVYYGKRQYMFVLDGYETLKVDQPAPPPWYEYPGLDFVSEVIWPVRIKDVRRPPPFQLHPLQQPNPNQVLQRAQELRSRGATFGPIPPPAPPPPSAPPPTAPAPRVAPQ